MFMLVVYRYWSTVFNGTVDILVDESSLGFQNGCFHDKIREFSSPWRNFYLPSLDRSQELGPISVAH